MTVHVAGARGYVVAQEPAICNQLVPFLFARHPAPFSAKPLFSHFIILKFMLATLQTMMQALARYACDHMNVAPVGLLAAIYMRTFIVPAILLSIYNVSSHNQTCRLQHSGVQVRQLGTSVITSMGGAYT